MSSVSKSSSRSSSSSGFSSIGHEQFQSTFTLQTTLNIERADINARTIFCGEQDSRLNELRRMTGAIIDLHVVPGTRRPFERVNWTISHRNPDVCDFVLRRLNHWMQQTQLTCDMAYEDALFLEEQHEKRTRTKPGPPISVANFTRRQRTRSLTQSETAPFNVNYNRMPGTPLTSTYKRESTGSMISSRTVSNLNNKLKIQPVDQVDMNELMERAKWSGVLSDTSDQEVQENRVCFADTVSLSKLAEYLRHHHLQISSSVEKIDEILDQTSMNVTHREYRRQMANEEYFFHRLVLDDHILFPVGISLNSEQARRLAYRQMLEVCLNSTGVLMKMLMDNRVKVIKREAIEEHVNETTMTEQCDVNGTYLSAADLSTLSHYKLSY